MTQQREALLKRCTETVVGDFDRQSELLAQLASLQCRYQLHSVVIGLAVNCSSLTTVQSATYMLASYPWCPSLTALNASIQRIRAVRTGTHAPPPPKSLLRLLPLPPPPQQQQQPQQPQQQHEEAAEDGEEGDEELKGAGV